MISKQSTRTIAAWSLAALALIALAGPAAAQQTQKSKPTDRDAADDSAAAPIQLSGNALQQVRTYIQAKETQGLIQKSATPAWKTRLPRFPTVKFSKGKTWYWNLETNKGKMKIKLLSEEAPNHVANFLYLTELGFFDDVVFHRVIPGFMAQGGDPTGSGRGTPGYRFGGEFRETLKHDRPGLLSMANAGPGTDGSQFFLTFVETPWLDGKHTIFGEIVEGMDTLKALESKGTPGRGAPTEKLYIVKATISDS